MTYTHQNSIKMLQEKGWQLEMKIFYVLNLRYRKEKIPCLSEKGSSKEIFKKYGVTVTAIVLAAGVTIGAVIGTITNALKKLGTDLGNGLKNIGAKAASALPGLIGAIVSFLFKAAGSAIGFLAKHTWLLILAVVAFLFQKLMKMR